jgi:peptide/nickel transport system substrate-binding protein
MNPQDQQNHSEDQQTNSTPETNATPPAAIPDERAPLAPNQDISSGGSVSEANPGQHFAQPVVSPSQGNSGFKKLVLALLALIVLAGAGYGVYSLTKSDKTDTKLSAMAQKQDINQLNVGVVAGSIALYPQSTSDSYAQAVSQQVYEGLVGYEDQTKIVPLLATGWSNPDSSTWDFDLRKDVKFHSGNTMKAADVVASLNAAKANTDLEAYNSALGDIKALNDYKVEIKTSKPDPFLLNKLTYLMILDSKDLKASDGSNATGPFQVKSGTKPTDTEIQLTAFKGYHGGHVYIQNLKFIVEADEAQASKDIKDGKINMAGEYSSADPDTLKGLGLQKIKVDDPAVTFMTTNSVAAGPLQNLKVRQALKQSLDIPAIIKAANFSAEPASQLITKAIPGYNPSVTVAKQDKTKAKQLLTEAGYPNGVTLDLEVTAQSLPLAQEIAKQAKEVGITINVITEASFDDLLDKLLGGKTQLAILSYSSDLLDSGEVFDTVLRQTGNYKSADLDKYLDEAAGTVDQAKRLKYLQQASQSIDDNVASIPLVNRQRTWFTDKSYVIQFDSIASDPGVNFWKVYLTN